MYTTIYTRYVLYTLQWKSFQGKKIYNDRGKKKKTPQTYKTKIGPIELLYVIVIVTLFCSSPSPPGPDPKAKESPPSPVTSFPPTDQIHQHTWPVMGNSRPVPGGHRWAEVINVLLFL